VNYYLLAGMSRLIHWLAVQLVLFGQNKFPVPGYSETVFLLQMDDHHFPSTLKKRCALQAEFPVGRGRRIRD
jgi:hypothetical protein